MKGILEICRKYSDDIPFQKNSRQNHILPNKIIQSLTIYSILTCSNFRSHEIQAPTLLFPKGQFFTLTNINNLETEHLSEIRLYLSYMPSLCVIDVKF